MAIERFSSVDAAAAWALARLPVQVVMAAPLGLGKPNPLINAIYARVKADPKRSLHIFTALSLAVPRADSDLARRFLGPFRERQWGAGYPELQYLKDLEAGCLPANIRLHEFYLQAGKSLGRPEVQRDYISVNYTHAVYAVADRGVNLLVQMVARHPSNSKLYSLSCNPDLTLDIKDFYRQNGKPLLMIAAVNPELPYCADDAEVSEDFFDVIVDAPEMHHKLFALPRQPLKDSDYLIGLHASLLIEDGGTLQIGIGSLSEAVVYCLRLRQQNNEVYRALAGKLALSRPYARQSEKFHTETFTEGLYGTSEMVMDGFMHLRRAGILKREVFDLEKSVRRYLHGAFYLGSQEFYQWLRELHRAGERGLCMTRVSKVNDLYDENELALRRQRVKARFLNTCMQATLFGGAASDTGENGQVVSGVGGQYNFVAMSHELPDSFSVLMLKSLRESQGTTVSNVVWGHCHLTIPRHLRDVVVTEYGVAFLKNRSDEECVQAMLAVCDARFQEPLRQRAVQERKLSPSWRVPEWSGRNEASWPSDFLAEFKRQGLFPAFPFGSDFTPVEEKLAPALSRLKRISANKRAVVGCVWRGLRTDPAPHREALERMQLWEPAGLRDHFYRRLLLGAL